MISSKMVDSSSCGSWLIFDVIDEGDICDILDVGFEAVGLWGRRCFCSRHIIVGRCSKR